MNGPKPPPRIEISKRLAFVNSASTVGRQILGTVVFVWLQQHLVRHISPCEYSLLPVLAALMVFVPLLTIVLTGGIGRYVVEAYARGDDRRVTQIVSSVFPVLFCAAFGVVAGGGTLAWHVDRVLTITPGRLQDARIMLGIMMLGVAIQLCSAPFRVGPHVRQKFVLRNIIEIAADLLNFTILFVLLFGVSTQVLWVVVATQSARLCETVVVVAVSRRLVPALRFRRSEFRWHVLRQVTSFGAWNVLWQLGSMIRAAANPLVLNEFAATVDVASFHLGSMADRQIRPLLNEASWPLQPALTAMHVDGDKERLASVFIRVGRLTLWLGLLLGVPLAVFGGDFFRLYLREKYADYASATTVMQLLFAVYPVICPVLLLTNVAVATARIRLMMTLWLVDALLGLGLSLYFVGVLHMGAIGAALAVLAADIAVNLFGVWPLALRMLGLRFSEFARETLFPGLVPAIVSGVAALLARALATPNTWLALGGCIVGTAGIYVTVLSVCLRPADRKDLRRVLAALRYRAS